MRIADGMYGARCPECGSTQKCDCRSDGEPQDDDEFGPITAEELEDAASRTATVPAGWAPSPDVGGDRREAAWAISHLGKVWAVLTGGDPNETLAPEHVLQAALDLRSALQKAEEENQRLIDSAVHASQLRQKAEKEREAARMALEVLEAFLDNREAEVSRLRAALEDLVPLVPYRRPPDPRCDQPSQVEVREKVERARALLPQEAPGRGAQNTPATERKELSDA